MSETKIQDTAIGFIGMGVMGQAMALNLLRAGAPLTVFNRTEARVKPITDEGGRAASDPVQLASTSSIVFLCLSNGSVVEEVLFGEIGVASSLEKGAIVCDFSTISPRDAKNFALRLAETGVEYVDAPVSGGDVGARNGTLTVMAGGSEGAFSRLEPYLKIVGKNIHHVGDVGAGQNTKCVNQIAVAGAVAAMAEAFELTKALGLDPEKTLEIISSGAAGSWSLSNYGPRVLSGDLKPGFSSAHMLKDLKIALDESDAKHCSLPVSGMIKELYVSLVRKGGDEFGNHALSEVYKDLNKE